MSTKLENLLEIRRIALELNKYPEICGEDSEDYEYPETKLEKAYCSFLWQIIDEAIRGEK